MTNVDIRVDLQVDGMGDKGHKMFTNEPWPTIHTMGFAMAEIHNKPVTCKYTELAHWDDEHGCQVGSTWIAGRFVPDPDVKFIPEEIYEEVE